MRLPAGLLAGAAVVACAALAACGNDGGISEPDVNPGLLDESTSLGLASGRDLPQGSAPFVGPGGLAMDATAEEFVQQLTWRNGTVWRTSGVSIRAVPDEAVAGAPIDGLGFTSAATGVLSSVRPGTYALQAEVPQIDFINRVDAALGWIRRGGTRSSIYASAGSLTIESIDYFSDVYTCSLKNLVSIRLTECTYKLGVIRGTIEFRVPLPEGGEIVQQRTDFSLPIMRRTIVAVENER